MGRSRTNRGDFSGGGGTTGTFSEREYLANLGQRGAIPAFASILLGSSRRAIRRRSWACSAKSRSSLARRLWSLRLPTPLPLSASRLPPRYFPPRCSAPPVSFARGSRAAGVSLPTCGFSRPTSAVDGLCMHIPHEHDPPKCTPGGVGPRLLGGGFPTCAAPGVEGQGRLTPPIHTSGNGKYGFVFKSRRFAPPVSGAESMHLFRLGARLVLKSV